MKLNELTVGRKINLGNFESLEIRISVSPEAKEEQKQFNDAVDEMIIKLDEQIKISAGKIRK